MRRVVLWRILPFPAWKRVTVQRITVRGFREAVRVATEHVLGFTDRLGRKPTPEEALQSLGDPEVCDRFADLIAVGERPRFYRRWRSQGNGTRLMRASRDVEGDGGWPRLTALIDWSGERVKAGGGIGSDIRAICRIWALSPLVVLDMAMQDFLDLCDFVGQANEAAHKEAMRDDPTLDPNAEPTPLGDAGGLGKVWIN